MSIPQLRKGRQLDIPVALITTVTVIGLILLLGIPVARLIGIGVSERGLAAITQSFGANVDTLVNTLVLGLCVGTVGTSSDSSPHSPKCSSPSPGRSSCTG